MEIQSVREIAAGGVAAAGVLTLTPVAARILARGGAIDEPSARSSHVRPTIRGAGIVTGPMLFLALVTGWDRLTLSLAAVALASTALGGMEDFRGASVRTRLAVQGAIAAVFVASAVDIAAPFEWPAAIGATLFIVGYTNAFNFMDGIDGISAVSVIVMGFAFVAFAFLFRLGDLPLIGAVLVGTAVGFLPLNFLHARIFLGDSGSYSFGAVIACAAVAAWRAGVPADVVLAPMAIYLADTGTVLVRRLSRREPVTEPHRDHVYQRLVQLGASHAQSTAVVGVCSGGTAVLGLAAARAGTLGHWGVVSGVILVLGAYLSLPRIVATRRGARSAKEA